MAFKKNYYLVLDCETATLPFIRNMELTPKERQQISIAKPLIYDIGWTIVTRAGEIVKRVSYLVQETFFVPNVFNTAYYRDKRPIYMQALSAGTITAKLWNDIADELLKDCRSCAFVAAYNAMFDFKKAIPFTEHYIKKLYSDDYNKWEASQFESAKRIRWGEKPEPISIDLDNFCFRKEKFPIVDIWNIAAKQMVNTLSYKGACAQLPMISASGLYFKTSAEAVYRFLLKDYSFEEAHTALNDAEIESEILFRAFKSKKKVEKGISAFPFRELGTTTDFLLYCMNHNKSKVTQTAVENVIDIMNDYLTEDSGKPRCTNFGVRLWQEAETLRGQMNKTYGCNKECRYPNYDKKVAITRTRAKLENARDNETREKLKATLDALLAEIDEND